MTFAMGKVVKSIRALRRWLAALPLGEKLRMLNYLHKRFVRLITTRPRRAKQVPEAR